MDNTNKKNLKPLLSIKDLRTIFQTKIGEVVAVDGVNIDIQHGEILAVVGESGCGKSVLARSILRIVPYPGFISHGSIQLDGIDILNSHENVMNNIRGDLISMVFQEPMASLNPVLTVGDQISEILVEHRPKLTSNERRQKVLEMMHTVGIASPENRINAYPHQLSGGMRQRIMIAMALICGSSKLLIADEPTTSLDVTIQAQILDLFKKLQTAEDMSIMLITHDLGVVAEIADKVAVMYAGSIVEFSDKLTIFKKTSHPYTIGLLKSLPQKNNSSSKEPLYTIKGMVPSLSEVLPGCKFYSRCPHALEEVCLGQEPPFEEITPGHWVRCYRLNIVNEKELSDLALKL